MLWQWARVESRHRQHSERRGATPILARRYWGIYGLALVTCFSALALGGAHVWVVLFATAAVATCGALALADGSLRRVPAPAAVMAFLGLFTLAQSIPLPAAWLRFTSPAAAEAWERSLLPFGIHARFGSISLDPGASCIETAKWLAYAVAFSLAASFARRRGAAFGIAVVFGTSLLLALATLGHGLVGATTVFGLYEPQLGPASNHIGPILNPNCLAGYLVLGTLCGFGLLISDKVPLRRWLWGAATAVVMGVAVLSGSRGGFAALVLGASAFTAITLRARRRRHQLRYLKWYDWVGAASVLAGAAAFAFLGAQDNWFELTHGDLSKLRMTGWVLPLLRDYPAFGVGRGAFESVFPLYKPTADNIIYANPENIFAQWLSEWGVLAGVLGVAGLSWTLRPSRLGFGRRSLVSGALIGVAALVFQNLVDFSLELFAPMLAVTVILGSCWGQQSAARTQREERTGWSMALVASTLLAVGLAATRGRWPVSLERPKLQAELARLDVKGPPAAEFWKHLRGAMERHPAEPYFPRLGALLALKLGNVEPLPWIERALERGPVDSRTHWILARVLQRRGYLQQAMLEARLAVEYDANLAAVVGTTVAGWPVELPDIEKAAPQGTAGSQLAYSAASVLNPNTELARREALFRLGIRRDPGFVPAHRALANELLHAFSEARCSADLRPKCQTEILAQATILDQLEPGSADGSLVRAELYRLTDQAAEADKMLSGRCPTLAQEERSRCWQALLSVALAPPASRQLALRAAAQLVRTACALEKDCEQALLYAGEAMRQLGDWPEALDYFQSAVRIEPAVQSLLSVADAATALGRTALADHALQLAEGHARANVALLQQIRRKREVLFGSAAVDIGQPAAH
jgi:tetratricopeptide (TPR) repeat protein